MQRNKSLSVNESLAKNGFTKRGLWKPGRDRRPITEAGGLAKGRVHASAPPHSLGSTKCGPRVINVTQERTLGIAIPILLLRPGAG